jgi:isopropylmalate/homocitrate/citramalate synthase
VTLRGDIVLEDTTLRDGEQTPGVALSVDQKTAVLHSLLDMGVSSIEVGIPAMGGEELDFLRSAVDLQGPARLVAWNRGVREDVQQSLDLGYRAVHIGLPTSSVHLDRSVRKDRGWLLATATELIKVAKDAEAYVSISAEDLARTEPAFLQEYAGVVREAGADRLRLSDTVGMLDPEGYGERVRLVTSVTDIDVQCHAHNDYGLATANTIAGLAAGARYFHTTINGVGERAGMADMAQVVVILKKFHGVDLGIDLTKLTALSRQLTDFLGLPVLPWQPVVGPNVFAHESGIHVNAMLRDTSTFEPFPPEEVGNSRRYVLGKHSGRALVAHLLKEKGIEPEEKALGATLVAVRKLAVERGGAVADVELDALYQAQTAR